MTIEVALIRQEQTGSDGGAQTIIDLMIQAINKESDINLSLLCRKWEVEKLVGHKVILDPPFTGRTHKYISFRNSVTNYLSKNKFDLIQSHERFNGCHIFRAGDGVHKIWLERKAIKMNLLQRLWMTISPYHNAILREERAMFASNTLKKVICNSYMVRKEILDNFPIAEDKVDVIYNGVDLKRYHPVDKNTKKELRESLQIPVNSTVFIFPGSGFERKNLASTIEAFSTLDENSCLIVLGRDKRQKKYEALVKQYQCAGEVIFCGAQSREKMPSFYQAADVLVLPTIYDPFPNVILEGLATGLPCITSTSCGAVDMLEANHCGVIIEAYDVAKLKRSMLVYTNPSKIAEESVNARSMAGKFTQEKMQKKLRMLYEEVLSANND